MNTAARLFKEFGYDATSVRMIAHHAGVSVGAVIAVGSKDDLLVSSFLREIEQVSAKRAEAPPTSAAASPILVVEEIFTGYFHLISNRADLARAWGAALLTNARHADTLRYLHDSLTTEVNAVLIKHASQESSGRAVEDLYVTYLGYLFGWASGIYSEAEAISAITNKVQRVLQEIGVK